MRIAYVVSDLKRVGPTNQTLNIIKNSEYRDKSIVITLFDEPNDSMISEYKQNKIEIISLKLNRTMFMLNGRKKLLRVLRRNDVSIVHSYGIKADCLCERVVEKNKFKHIITLRNYPKEDILTRMNVLKGNFVLNAHLNALLRCENVVCCSKTIQSKMKKDYPKKKFRCIQNGVDTKKYSLVSQHEKNALREKNQINVKDLVFISTNSFIPRKRIEETIDGFLKLNVNSSILLLLGDGILYDTIKDKYKSYNNIKFLGKTEDVNTYLQLSDIYISSSESEGLPNSVLEAVSCGLPVVLSNIPQHQEILEEINDCGLTYKIGNLDDLKHKLSECVEKKSVYSSKKINSLTMENMSKKYCNLYKEIGVK